jgi:hypothetical protein
MIFGLVAKAAAAADARQRRGTNYAIILMDPTPRRFLDGTTTRLSSNHHDPFIDSHRKKAGSLIILGARATTLQLQQRQIGRQPILLVVCT